MKLGFSRVQPSKANFDSLDERLSVNRIQRLIAMAVAACFYLAIASGVQAAAVDAPPTFPAILQAGFNVWPRDGAAGAIDIWQKGGLLEGDRKVSTQIHYFMRVAPVIGAYKSFDLIQAQRTSQASQLVYLALNFDRAAVYARFLLYRTEQDWVVQNMDFNVRPEMLIPWMALPSAAPSN
jgi:hypothetical protein